MFVMYAHGVMSQVCMTLQLFWMLPSQYAFGCHALDMLPCHKRLLKLGCALCRLLGSRR